MRSPIVTLLPLLFPTGRTVSPRWRSLPWLAVVAGALLVIDPALRAGPLDGAPAVINPLGVDHALVRVAGAIGFGTLIPVALLSIASLVVRFRRSTGVERQQLKWVAASAALLPVAFTGAGFGADAGWPLMLVCLLLVATAMAIAMLRYRLYDIDVVVNRAIVYATLTLTLATAYTGVVLLLQLALRPFAPESQLAVAGSTLVVAALFGPARARIQRTVDRCVYRSRYDAGQTLAAFSGRLRTQVDLDATSRDLRAAVHATVQPTHSSIWLRG